MALADVFGLVVVAGVVALMARMGEDEAYIRALYVPFLNLFLAVLAGVALSNQVASALSRGRGRTEDVAAFAASFARLFLAVATVVIVAVALAAPFLAGLLGVEPDRRDEFVSFVRWMAPAEMLLVGSYLIAASLRGFGKAVSGAVLAIASAGFQLVSVAVFGLGLGFGLLSVPASVAGGAVVGLVLGIVLLRRHGLWRPGQSLSWRRESIGLLIGVGVPVAGTQLLIVGYSAGLLWVLRDTGDAVISGFGAALTLQMLLIMPGVVLGSATAIVLNQVRGAGHARALPAGYLAGMQLCVGVYAAIALLVWLGREPIAVVMSGDPAAAAQTSAYLAAVGLTYVIQGPVLAALASMEQLGAGALALALNVVYFAGIVVVGAMVVDDFGARGVYATIAGGNVVGVLVIAISFFVIARLARRAPPAPAGGPDVLPADSAPAGPSVPSRD